MLTTPELERYARQIVLPEIGGPGQQKLKRSRILLIGAGGIGSPAALYLAAAGIGTLGLVDDDAVSPSNLQRQILFAAADVGRAKIDAAAERLNALNDGVKIERHHRRIDGANGLDLVRSYDLVIDGSDNFDTRYAAADAAEAAKIPLVTGAVGRFDGSLTVLKPYETGKNDVLNPGYRDLFPEKPPEGLIPACAETGVVGALTGVIGTLMAMEVIKLVTGIGDPLVGRLMLYDSLSARFDIIKYKRRQKAAE
jgi:molybdopterin/thiamine biosynthesis adenylyltransferase